MDVSVCEGEHSTSIHLSFRIYGPPPHKKCKQETFEVTNINTLHNDKLGHKANDTDSPPAPKKNATQNNMANLKLT